MDCWICRTCGTQFSPIAGAPGDCPICQDERQYVGHDGQQWTTLAGMREDGFSNEVREEEPDLVGIGTKPRFAIGQRALLVRTGAGNVLWDCISYIDDTTAEAVQRLGGIDAIAISHPHYYSSMVEWAERFDARIYLHETDRRWVMRPSDRISFWSGETLDVKDGVRLIRLGGHFPGGTVLHWRDGAGGAGAVLSGDILYVVQDRRWVSFMYSFPNLIPLPKSEVRRIADTISRYEFDRVYAAWFDNVVQQGAKDAVRRSAERYVRALDGHLCTFRPPN